MSCALRSYYFLLIALVFSYAPVHGYSLQKIKCNTFYQMHLYETSSNKGYLEQILAVYDQAHNGFQVSDVVEVYIF